MSKRIHILTVVALAASLLAACSGGGAGEGLATQGASNSSLAIAGNYNGGVVAIGNSIAVLVNEVEQGGQDLNGDGDTADNVLFIVDSVTGAMTNTGFAGTTGLSATTTRMIFSVPEFAQGNVDMNGDGDTNDILPVIFDPAAPVSPTNPTALPFAVAPGSSIISSPSHFAIAVDEAGMGMDIDGNSEVDDFIVHMFNPETMAVFNTNIPTQDFSFKIFGDQVLFTGSEADIMVDQNNDTDTGDNVLFFADAGAMSVTPVGSGGFGRAVSAGAYFFAGTTADPYVAYSIAEGGEGLNLNGTGPAPDTDISDNVFALFRVNTLTETIPSNGIACEATRISASATRVSFSALESDNGPNGVDLSQDGDAADRVPFWVALNAPTQAVNVGIAQDDGSTGLPFVCDEFMLFLASESDQGAMGTNFNDVFGDTDTSDNVFFFQSLVVGASQPINLRYAGDEGYCAPFTNDFIVMSVSEAANDTDFNSDSDTGDEILFFQRVVGGQPVPQAQFVPLYGNTTVVNCADSARFVSFLPENATIAIGDANRDGDFDDVVVQSLALDKATGSAMDYVFLGTVATNEGQNSFPTFLTSSLVVFPAAEDTIGPGRNLNGDMGDVDTFDTVLQFHRFSCAPVPGGPGGN